MPKTVTAQALKEMLSDRAEIAVLDMREHGVYGEGHLFFAVPLPYSRLELSLGDLVPNKGVRVVLYDDGDGIAERAAARATELGYTDVSTLEGGAPAWKAAGYTLYQGVNLPSKTFGELVELERHTPRITAEELQAMREAGENMVIVDGRPFSEYSKFNIPDGICCPNGELPLRIAELAKDPTTKVVVNCAGRTRSIIGAQTLIDFGVENPVVALENGTQGWFLAGLEVERGADRMHPLDIRQNALEEQRVKAQAFAGKCGSENVSAGTVAGWLGEKGRTTYVFDVRTPEENAADGTPQAIHAAGGQLIQTTDQWVGVRNARIVVADSEGVRAPMVAGWLRQLGHEAYVLDGGIAAARELPAPASSKGLAAPAPITAGILARAMEDDTAVQIIDLRPSMTYRKGHIDGAVWSIRPRLADALATPADAVVLVADDPGVAALAAKDLADLGVSDVSLLEGGPENWQAAGLGWVATPDSPTDAECIDFLFFTHERHAGIEAAARQYLAWEIGLVDQLDDQERGVFKILSH